MAKFIIKSVNGGQFRFVLKAGNRETILTSETYATKQGCKDGIASVRSNAPYDFNYTRKTAVNGQFYFTLKAGNHEVIGTSEMYTTSYNRDRGVESVKENSPKAELLDETLVSY